MDNSDDQDPSDCCNSGCNPCILDVRNKAQKKHDKETGIESINAISPTKYTPFSVVFMESFKSFLLITLKYEKHEDESVHRTVKFDAGQYFILKAPVENDTSDHFTRPYTPIKSSRVISILNIKESQYEYSNAEQFQILAKIYNDGLMSKYLSKLKIEDVTLWRGPYGSYKYRPNAYRNLLLICQGVAITAMFSIINEVLIDEDDNTKLMLFYCCKNMQNVMLRENLYDLRSNWNFDYKIFLSEGMKDYSVKYKEPIINRRLIKEDLGSYLEISKDIGVLLCGSDNFMKYFKDITLHLNMKEENVTLF